MPSFPLLVVYSLWIILFLDLHRYVAAIGPSVAAKTQAVLFAILIAVMLLRLPDILSRATAWTLCLPLLVFAVSAVAAIPGSIHVGFAVGFAQALLLYWVFLIATITFVRRPRDATLILALFAIQILWYALHARGRGLVPWHSFLGNYDDFGALMVMGIGLCFYLGMATDSKRIRWFCFALSAYCVLAVVTTFARGAFLSALLVGGIIWYRSPRKGLATGALVVGAGLIILAATVLYPGGEYWARIMSSFEEGTQTGTGGHRWHLWNSAWKVFLENPLFGAGGFNFGLYVVQHFGFESVYGYESAATLWNRNLHNIYVQVLSELGLFGTLAFAWMILAFWKWNRVLRTPAFVRAWSESTGGQLDLRNLSYALELGMIGYLAGGFFYGPLLYHWPYTLIAANLMLYAITHRLITESRRTARRSLRIGHLQTGSRPPIVHPSGIM